MWSRLTGLLGKLPETLAVTTVLPSCFTTAIGSAVCWYFFLASHPLLDGGDAFDGPAFISYDGMIGKARAEAVRVAFVFGREIVGQEIWKIERHRFSSVQGWLDRLVAPFDCHQ